MAVDSMLKEPRSVRMPEWQLTWDDMRAGLEATVERYEEELAEFGIGKFIPPPDWRPRAAGYGDVDVLIPRPIRQNVTGGKGIFRSYLVEEKPQQLKAQFEPAACAPDNNPRKLDMQNLEAVEYQFWRTLRFQPPLYGADVEGSLFDADVQGWNPQNLDSLLVRTMKKHEITIPGVSTPYLYFGTWRSIFAWHTEDMDLYSMNYLHYGKPKSWYAIAPKHRAKFEKVVSTLAETQELFKSCPEFMRHKELMISPDVLKLHNVPYVTGTQYEREFIINYPGAYHSGFNHGYNCAESTNFATERWVDIGKDADYCECRGDTVKIDMRLFGVKMPSPSPSPCPETPPATPKPAKRRGRPPGSKNKVVASGAVPATGGVVKRGPGRPRKHPLPDAAVPAVPVKRGPGRPRKHPLPVEAASAPAAAPAVAAGPVTRPTGRPRKHPPPDPSTRKPPGRPRKHPLPEGSEAPAPARGGRAPKKAAPSPAPAPSPSPTKAPAPVLLPVQMLLPGPAAEATPGGSGQPGKEAPPGGDAPPAAAPPPDANVQPILSPAQWPFGQPRTHPVETA